MMLRATTMAVLLAAAAAPGAARAQVRLAADALSGPGVTMHGVGIELHAGDASASPQLHIGVDVLTVPMLGWRKVAAQFDGRLSRPSRRRWHVQGDLSLRGAAGEALRKAALTLDIDVDSNTLQARLDSGGGNHIDLAMPMDDPAHLELDLAKVPLGWLQGVLAQAWPDGRLGAGRVDAGVVLDVLDDGLRGNGRFKLDGAAFDSRAGTLAGQSLRGSGNWSLRKDAATSRLDLDARLDGGEWLLGPVYASLPPSPARVQLRADFSSSGTRLSSVHFDDGDALRFDGSLHFSSDGSIDDVQLDGFRAQLPAAYDHYGKEWLATLGYDALRTAGMLTGSLVVQNDALQRFSFDADGVSVLDPSRRVGVDGLRGRLDWERDGRRDAGALAWNALTLMHLPFGAASTRWRAADGALELVQPAALPMLGGTVLLQKLNWSPPHAAEATRLDLALAASGIDLQPLCELFGWPRFGGTLGGAIPGLDFDGERVVLDGGLSMNVFDGFVDVTRLSLAHPFGAAPELHADIAMRGLDLEPLTHVFDFGSISGRLDGDIGDLRMIAWKPVVFDAALHADAGGRISQRAIDSLGNLGGGLGGGLQSTVLKVFKSFGYDRIGLGCRLRDDVCRMHGIGAADDGGYVIVDGRGLPHIEVIGHQGEVDWPTLVARLAAATAGGGVRVE